jgi:hypothetical protein
VRTAKQDGGQEKVGFIVRTAKQDGGQEKVEDEEGRKGRGMKRRRRKCGEK